MRFKRTHAAILIMIAAVGIVMLAFNAFADDLQLKQKPMSIHCDAGKKVCQVSMDDMEWLMATNATLATEYTAAKDELAKLKAKRCGQTS